MIELWYWPTPNGHKITLLLEEAGIAYEVHPVNIGKGEQFDPNFLAFSPNNRMPAIIDRDPDAKKMGGGEPITVFESGAILQYLAEKTGKFGGTDARDKVVVTEWLMWQMAGLGPMLGQNHHFTRYAPEQVPYAIDRYVRETTRLYGVLDKRLEGREFIAGDYSIADMACYPWILPDIQGQDMADFPNLARWHAAIKDRPATKRAYAKGKEVNPDQGAPMTKSRRRCCSARPPKPNRTTEQGEESMFSHMTVGTNDIDRSRAFYDALFGAVGGKPGRTDDKGRLIYMHNGGLFLVTPPIDGAPATHANGGTIGFAMDGPDQADAWHAAGVAHGGTAIEDPPGIRSNAYGSLYLAYLRDPDGNKLCAMHRMPAAA